MNRDELRALLEKLTGQGAPFNELPQSLVVLGDEQSNLGYSQLNELLLLLGFDRITHSFFRYLLDGQPDYESGQAFSTKHELEKGVARFREMAILLYGNVKFAFKLLSRSSEQLEAHVEAMRPVPESVFKLRHAPVLPLSYVAPDDAYLTGYIIEKQIKDRLDANPGDADAKQMQERRVSIVNQSTANQTAYLGSDHLDVYIATSMREKHEFRSISRLTNAIFSDAAVAELNLRWFDPTQAYCPDRIDKGLSEALMLRRASCTIYLAQESDTLGKDSELASTLAQGKPVIAFIPEATKEWVDEHLHELQCTHPEQSRRRILLDQLRVYEPSAAWTDHLVRSWCDEANTVDDVEIVSRLEESMRKHYDKRADTLRKSHPLGIQVNLQTGVANGVLVVRTASDCAKLLRNIFLHELAFDLEDGAHHVVLREKISGCVFRVMTQDRVLTNTFWNFYLDPAD
jgi:hypothetical protein